MSTNPLPGGTGTGSSTGPIPVPGQRRSRRPFFRFGGKAGALSRRRIEQVGSQATGFFGFIFTVQTMPLMLESTVTLKPPIAVGEPIVLTLAILAVLITSLTGKGVILASRVTAILFLLALITWPAAVADPTAIAANPPWLWYLCTVAMACSVVSFPVAVATAYNLSVPIVYAVVRTLPAGGGTSATLAILDALYVFILGFAMLLIFTNLRRAADRVDTAQRSAVRRYAEAVKRDATESERIRVDSMVHDRVLTTLSSAAKSTNAMGRDLAVSMSIDALRSLQSVESVTDATHLSEVGLMVERLTEAATAMAPTITIEVAGVADQRIPTAVADAVFATVVQALSNSVQHAAPAGEAVNRSLSILARDDGTLAIIVRDSGVGFVLDDVPPERLGVRISIQARMERAGGRATIVSRLNEGTSVTVVWPAIAYEEGLR
jgi:signal transduction histidine kinase